MVESSVSFQPPPGFAWTDAPKLAAQTDSDFLSASLSLGDTGGTTGFTTRTERFTGLFPAARAAEERQAMIDVSRLLAPALVLERIVPK